MDLRAVLPIPKWALPRRVAQPGLEDGAQVDGKVEREANKAAPANCVAEINRMIDGGQEFKFAVLTGDTGLEKLIAEDAKSFLQRRTSARRPG